MTTCSSRIDTFSLVISMLAHREMQLREQVMAGHGRLSSAF